MFALGAYWADKCEAALRFSELHSEHCYRLRYEDLVGDFHGTIRELFEWLGVDSDVGSGFEARMFHNDAPAETPGDYKIPHSVGVYADSVGRGWVIPVDLMPPHLQSRVDAINAELGYPPLGGDVHPASCYRIGEQWRDSGGRERANDLKRFLIAGLHAVATGDIVSPFGPDEPTLKLVLVSEATPWVIDTREVEFRLGAEPSDCTVLADAEGVWEVLTRKANLGVALRHGKIKVLCPERTWSETAAYLNALITLLGVGMARAHPARARVAAA